MIKRALTLSFITIILLTVPVLAVVAYQAPYTVTENASVSYGMFPAIGLSNNQWMADNGFMNSSANDTRIETLGGLEKPHMVSDNRTLTAVPVPANSQTNLYFTTGNSELAAMDIITGRGGYITTSDNTDIELSDNFTVELAGWCDMGVVGSSFQSAYIKKQEAFAIYTSDTGNITAAIEGMWLDFERTNTDYVTISDQDEFSFNIAGADQPFSVSAWVNFEDATSSSIIAKAKDATHWEWFFATDGADKLTLRVLEADAAKFVGRTSLAVTSNQSSWVHYVGTYDGSETSAGINLYIDGVDSDTANAEALPYTGMTLSDSPVEIGAYTTHAFALMDGKMGEVKIFNVELTPAQVLEEYNGGYFDNIVGRWTLAEGTGLPQDSSGNGFHATANTADWVGTYVTASSVSSGNHTVITSLTENLLANGSFETGDPPTGWTLAGAGATFAQSAAQIKIGSFSGLLTRSGADCQITQDITNYAVYIGEEVTFGCWIYATVANRAVLYLNDGVGGEASLYHSGVAGWEWLTATRTIDAGATMIRFTCIIQGGDTSAYFDGANGIVDSSITDYGNFVLSIDGVETGVWTDNATNFYVPDNDNDYVFNSNNVMPYADSITFTINGTEQLWYEPTSMIIGTNLPDRAGNPNNGVITWGANPIGVDVTIGSMVSSGQPSIGIGGEDPAQDVTPSVEVSDWYVDPDVTGALLANPMRPFVTLMSDNSTLTEIQAWRLLGLALVLLIAAVTARNVGSHQGLTMISAGTAIGGLVAMTIFPMWTLVFVIGMFAGGLVMERSPSL